MKRNYTATKTKIRQVSKDHNTEASRTGIDSVSKGVIITMGLVSAFIGIGAVSCLVVTMLMSDNSPLAMFSGWVQAITGM